jgi:hypothetical protein
VHRAFLAMLVPIGFSGCTNDMDGDGYEFDIDCDDNNSSVHPRAEEVCDGILDNNCDGVPLPAELDGDGDGVTMCGGDCNDKHALVHPGAPGVCDDDILDNDCDELTDSNESDEDGDGYTGCQGDCDDSDDTIHPDTYDPVDGLDNDCDGILDEDYFDCDSAPTSPLSQTNIVGARGFHGLAIDEFGYIVGSDGNSLIQADYHGNSTLFVPNVGLCEQMTYLPNGDLALVNTKVGIIQRISPEGVPSTITSAYDAYGVTVGPDGMLYAVGYQGIGRIDQTSGTSEMLVGNTTNGDTHVIGFSPDASKMYIGTEGHGYFYVAELDANFDPIGSPEVLAKFGGWHDAIAVDACGGIFVADYTKSALFRVHPDGTYYKFIDWDYGYYGHSLVWGTGVGGWREDALYVSLPYNNNLVVEVVVGIPPAGWGGTIYNAY